MVTNSNEGSLGNKSGGHAVKTNFSYRGGVLILGSLLWDPDRSDWRRNYFGDDFQSISVPSPIRYGRYSSGEKRQCPTIVLSSEFEASGCRGRAKFVTFHNAQMTIDEVTQAARNLSSAEGDNDEKFIKGNSHWCIVLFLLNPNLGQQERDYFIENWRKNYDPEITNEIQANFKMESETSAVFDANGQLRMAWPSELNDLDFVLATQTQPRKTTDDHSTYLEPASIAAQFHAKPEYFIKNRMNGINTVEDDEIISFLRAFDRELLIQNASLQDLSEEDIKAALSIK